MDINGIVEKALSRRKFLAGAGTAAAAALMTGCSDDGTVTLPASTTTAGITDNDILNFALNLEYLEAEFYLRAATGSGLATADIGAGTSTTGTGAGTVNGGSKITFVPVAGTTLSAVAQQNVANELAYTEQQHVRALRAALGPLAVARPNIDFVASFAAFATLAGVPSSFNPFGNFDSFIVAASNFEGVGVTAYNGAAPLLTVAANLTAAAGIMAVEAYHDGFGRTYITANATTLGTTAYPYLTYANSFANVRSLLSGGSAAVLADEKALVVANATTGSTIVPTDANALAFARTPSQVMHIVYGTFSPTAGVTTPQAGVTKGGFFPNGLNGTITATTA